MAEVQKRIHTLVLDTSPILLNSPSISTLRATADILITTAAVVAEIRGEEARSRFETLYKPFIEIKAAKSTSIKHVKEFARKTGDLAVLSATDLEIIALAYDLECERNKGDWRLRNAPGQKRLNGRPPVAETVIESIAEQPSDNGRGAGENAEQSPVTVESVVNAMQEHGIDGHSDGAEHGTEGVVIHDAESAGLEHVEIEDDADADDSDDSAGGWITATNLKKKQAQDESDVSTSKDSNQVLQVATMTGDFALQNVLLQMNLNLLSSKTCKRIANIKQTILRCHACFATTREMDKQFCARCGKPTLTRVSCTTNDRGEVKLHLKQNFQWNNRGNVYSIPKPTSGSANQKWKGPQSGGGQNGWGSELILSEDQKEFTRAVDTNRRTKLKDLMDEDFLPGILTGDRNRQGSDRVKVGAGRMVNSRKR